MLVSRVTPILLCGLGLLIVLSWQVSAQESTPAQATSPAAGLVRTQQGVAVPGATIRVVELATGRAWVSWTDENGNFEFPGLPRGQYRIEAQQLGFEPASKEIELNAQTPTIEFSLRIVGLVVRAPETQEKAPAEGAAAGKENPTSTEATPAPQGQQGAASTAAKPAPDRSAAANKRQQQVPPNVAEMIRQRMRARGFQQVDLTGQQNAPETPSQPDTGSAGVLGEASSSDAFLISGTVGRGATPGGEGGFNVLGGYGPMGGPGAPGEGGFPGQPGGQGGPGAMIQGGGGRPQPGPREQGQGGRGGQQGGGQARFGEGVEGLWGLQRILRQQVNRIRVSFYERYGNSALDARPYSLTEVNPAKIPTWRERMGAHVGGPLIIPGVYNGREKTFFFVNYNLARTRDPVDQFATVPTLPERGGNFCDRGVQLYDPSSNGFAASPRAPLGCSIEQASQQTSGRLRLDPAALGLLAFVPPPNLPGLVQNFHLQTRVPTATDAFNIRVLHTISAKVNAQGTYNFSEARTHAFQSFPDLESSTGTRGQNLMLGLTQNWTKRFIHDSRVFWSRSRTQVLNRFAFSDNIGANLGIKDISTDPINFGVPLLSFTNFTDANDPVPALRRNQTLRFVDSLSYVLPKHTLRAGGEIRRMQVNTDADPAPRGAFTFTGLMTSQLDSSPCTPASTPSKTCGRPIPGTGFDFADFLLGLPAATTERFGASSTYFRSWGFVAYFQDDWRIHPRFTLNWGLRYEAVTPPIELFDHVANLDVNSDFTAVATVTPGQPGPFNGPLPRSLVRGNYNNWSPRLAIAWKPSLKGLTQKHPMTVRAGYGIFYNTSIYNQLAASMANQPPWAQAQTRLTSVNQVLTLDNGFPPAPPATAKNTAAVDLNYRVGYAQIWNLTTETQVTQNLTMEVTYTGTKGSHLDLLRAPNRAPPGSPLETDPNRPINALGFTFDTSGAASIYHALQVRVQRRFARGLMVYGLYTYGKSIDNASSIGGGAPIVVQDDQHPELDRGLSSFDIRHQLRSGYLYELPFGERKHWAHKGWQAAAFGNWSLSGSITAQTSTPFTARVLGTAADSTGTGANFSERADQVGNPTLPGDQRGPLLFFNKAAFELPPSGRFGDAARNTIPGPGNFTFNFALARHIPFGKDQQHRIDFRWELSNLSNTPNFTGLSTVVNSTTYGRVLGTKAMRTMDFVMRWTF